MDIKLVSRNMLQCKVEAQVPPELTPLDECLASIIGNYLVSGAVLQGEGTLVTDTPTWWKAGKSAACLVWKNTPNHTFISLFQVYYRKNMKEAIDFRRNI